jgi:Right handed beta helix region/Bacterial Ig-like domain (group 2)
MNACLRAAGRKRRLPGLLAVVAALALAACSAKQVTAPSPSPSPAPTSSLTLIGTTVLSVGLTSQLVATYSTGLPGTAVTAPVSWQSATPSVAAVTAAGLVTAIGVGTATVTATAAGAAGSVTIKVEAPGTGTTVLTACGQLSPGSYTLSGDLPPTNGACLLVSNVSGVQLDCRGHMASTLLIDNASAVTISNCSVPTAVSVIAATTVTVTNCSFAGLVASNVVSLTATNSVFSAPAFTVQVVNGTNVVLSHDTVTSAGGGGAVTLRNGVNNQVTHTSIVGGYDGSPSPVGTDDGILLQGETGDVIQNNTISNVYDMGIEGVGIVQNVTLANNAFSNMGVAGMGSYWCTSWSGDVLRGNTVSMAPWLVLVLYEAGSNCGSTTPSALFTGNQFIANVFRNPAPGWSGSVMPVARLSIVMPGQVSGNLLQGNDFGANDGPNLSPLGGFADGGGNICGPLNPILSNFPCTGGSAAPRSLPPQVHDLQQAWHGGRPRR